MIPDNASVFPVSPARLGDKDSGKTPMVKWREESRPRGEWDGLWPAGANIGIDCGKSGWVVLDEDQADAVSDWLGQKPLETYTVRTGMGRHFVYLAPVDVVIYNTNKDTIPGLEVRAAGGYIVGEGSTHWTGAVYEAENDIGPVLLPAEAMGKLLELQRHRNGRNGRNGQSETEGDAPFVLPEKIETGQRNYILFHYTASLVGRGIHRQEALILLREAYSRCVEPFTAESPEAMWERVSKAYQPNAKKGTDTNGAGARPTNPMSLILPAEFYEARGSLRRIRAHAHAVGASADSVLYGALTRLSGMVPHQCRVQTKIGRGIGASLNLFCAACGAVGAGKSSGAGVSKDLYRAPSGLDFLDCLPLGSGEGVAESYMGEVSIPNPFAGARGQPKLSKVRAQVRHNIHYLADEGGMFNKLTDRRSGSTLGETCRSGWYGATIGNQNADQARRRLVDEGKYSMGMLIGFQPETVQPLLADAAAGTPQRFTYCWTVDPTMPEKRDANYKAPPPEVFAPRAGLITMAAPILDEIWELHHARATGVAEVARLDAHDYLTKVKLAGLLALSDLDPRHHVEEEDWRLAGIMWETSSRVRDYLVGYGQSIEAQENADKDRQYVEREGRAEGARQRARDVSDKPKRIAKLIARHVHATENPAETVGELRSKRIASRDRELFDEALELAEAEGWIVIDGEQVAPGPSRPS